ncbi:MAG: histone deacetylase, partial [Deltaproteobacteria bacterium]|nr:histone deacetylase [Deltaproteobacteria bacterium]MBW2173470.1 histone deacetylase [Deltaproteobacteria bacterium]
HLEGLRESVRAVLKELVGDSILTAEDLKDFEKGAVPPIVQEVIQVQKDYWPIL